MRRMLKWGKDPGDKDSWEEQEYWERTRMSGRDEVVERDGESWGGQGHDKWMRVLVKYKEGWGTRMPGGKRTRRKDKDFQGLRIAGGKRTLGKDKIAWEGQGQW